MLHSRAGAVLKVGQSPIQTAPGKFPLFILQPHKMLTPLSSLALSSSNAIAIIRFSHKDTNVFYRIHLHEKSETQSQKCIGRFFYTVSEDCLLCTSEVSSSMFFCDRKDRIHFNLGSRKEFS